MRLAKYNKDPDERKRYLVDYDQWLDVGETVAGAVFTVTNDTPATPLIVDGVAIDPGQRAVQYYVSGGAAGVDYEVEVRMTSNLGQIKEDTILFVLRSV